MRVQLRKLQPLNPQRPKLLRLVQLYLQPLLQLPLPHSKLLQLPVLTLRPLSLRLQPQIPRLPRAPAVPARAAHLPAPAHLLANLARAVRLLAQLFNLLRPLLLQVLQVGPLQHM
jgi:hypothetical protein